MVTLPRQVISGEFVPKVAKAREMGGNNGTQNVGLLALAGKSCHGLVAADLSEVTAGMSPAREFEQASILRHARVYFIGPRVDAALDTLHVFETLLLEELHRFQRAHAAFAVDIDRLVGIKLGEALW